MAWLKQEHPELCADEVLREVSKIPSALTDGIPFWFILARTWGTEIRIKSPAKLHNLVQLWERRERAP